MYQIEAKSLGDFDVAVCGGGIAGVFAAVTAARQGSKVILIESAGSLGGTVTESFMGNLIDADGKGSLIDELRDFLNAHDMTCPLRGAKADENGRLDDDEKAKFEELYNFINDNFDIQVGDRIFAQLDTFTSVFTACGGNKYRALDIMFANKFVRKINNSFYDGVSENLDKLIA